MWGNLPYSFAHSHSILWSKRNTWTLSMAITIYENLMEILFCRFGSFAMTVVKNQRYSSMLWLRNAWTANLITRAKHGAEQVAMARPLQWNWQGKDNCKCTQIECISYRDFPSLFQLPESYSWIEKIVVLPRWYWPCYLLGNRSCPAASTRKSLMIHL